MFSKKETTVTTANWIQQAYSDEEFEARKKMAIISAEIQLARLEKGWSQKEFAKLMGVTQGMVSKWENGDYNFSIKTVTSIFLKLGKKFDFEIEGSHKKSEKQYDNSLIVSINNNDFSHLHLEKNNSWRFVEGIA